MTRRFALVVDDLRTLQFPSEYDVVHARTVEHAAVELLRRPVHVLVLDHDLGRDEVKRLVTFIQMKAVTGERLEIGCIYIVSSNPQAHTEFPPALRGCGYTVGRGIGPAWIDNKETAFWANAAREIEEACNPYGQA
jgi:hypothetical protein